MASSLLPFLLYSLILQSNCVVAQTKSTIAIGDSYTAQTSSSPWLLSPSGEFAFGFLALKDTADLFLLSIWYAKISDKTVVWYANRDSPAPKGSKVKLHANDGLVLTYPNGDGLWNTTEVISDGVFRGVFIDTGNFVLENANSKSVWETFKFPSDILLPSQVVEKGGKLSSRLKETNFSKGRFELLLQGNGDLVMHSINLPSGYANQDDYYLSNTNGDTTSSAGTQLVFDRSGFCAPKAFIEEQCKKACMEDCLCSVAIFREGNSCWKKKLPLSNGRFDVTLGSKAFLKVRKDNTSLVPTIPIIVNKNNNRQTLVLVGSVLLSGSAILNVAFIVAICVCISVIFQYKKKLRSASKSGTFVEIESNLRCFTYEELEEATNGFDKELGRGAFGIVYEGVINTSSKTRVAVKKLSSFLMDQGHREFRNELNSIGLTHHKNLVRLLGFCERGSERLLVYEYMSNGTLASFLFNVVEEQKPSWKVRLEIAIGVARGLVYLHEECITGIIHCDIKPQNILLDDYFNARISDFGLAEMLNMNQSKTNTGIKGTRGYVVLEWFKNLPINAKVDVYSYGVVLLEIITLRRCVLEMDQEDEEKAILTDWAYDCYKEGSVDALVEGDNEALEDKEKLEKLVMIAIWCVQEDPYLRPTMRNVLHMLEESLCFLRKDSSSAW
ncbi:unnamed protein product [Trifolium pratense]|uniref:Uncharacterized protein n=1 Tax=Trifolium pratense TaxID=57577 RepID=A0ACB0L604_TRIPR|nr:unnamed protein product [Trifolium pratense]